MRMGTQQHIASLMRKCQVSDDISDDVALGSDDS